MFVIVEIPTDVSGRSGVIYDFKENANQTAAEKPGANCLLNVYVFAAYCCLIFFGSLDQSATQSVLTGTSLRCNSLNVCMCACVFLFKTTRVGEVKKSY